MTVSNAQEFPCPGCASIADDTESVDLSRQLIRCNACGFVYARSRNIPQGLYDEAYSNGGEYQSYVDAVDGEEAPHLSWAMRKFLKVPGGGRSLLDAGCSTGRFMLEAQSRQWEVTGLEISTRAAGIARETTVAIVHTVSLTDLNVASQFDAITAWEVLEHISDPGEFVRAAGRLLTPGGVFAISVPNWGSPWMRQSTRMQHWPPYHLNFWTAGSLRLFLERLGFVDVSVLEKPFAWEEELGSMKWALLPVSLARGILLHQRGMHLYATGRRP